MPLEIRKCRTCGADIAWITMPSGAKMPINSKAQQIVLVDVEANTGVVASAFISHFATCPQASDHRKKRSD
jgi:hypothetical protein